MISRLLSFLLISHIQCFTQFGSCPQQYLDTATPLLNRPIYYPLSKSAIFSQFKSFPEIRSLSIHRRLPSTVVLSVQLRKPIGTISSRVLGASTQALVDDQGLVYSGVTTSSLPRLLIPDSIELGQPASATQLSALKTLSSVVHISTIQLTGQLEGSVLTFLISPQTTVYVDVNKLPDDWPASLQSVFARSKIDGKLPHKIDMRFSHPYEE